MKLNCVSVNVYTQHTNIHFWWFLKPFRAFTNNTYYQIKREHMYTYIVYVYVSKHSKLQFTIRNFILPRTFK